jgi:hypothetical protein
LSAFIGLIDFFFVGLYFILLCYHHLTLFAQYAADILPLLIFFACRALNA